jgi:hypothetical protein
MLDPSIPNKQSIIKPESNIAPNPSTPTKIVDDTPIPSISLPQQQPIPSRSPSISPATSLSDKRARRKSLIPAFFTHLSSASPARSFRKRSSASLYTPTVSESSHSTSDSSVTDSNPTPHPSLGVAALAKSGLNRQISLARSKSQSLRSRASSLRSSERRPSDTASSDTSSARKIFTTTEALRLSVPLSALNHFQSITEKDISRKMHQTSSRLLRMTDDERPYTKVRLLPC